MLEKLRKKLQAVLDQMRGLNDAVVDKDGNVRSFTADEQTRYDAFKAEVETVRTAITRCESEEEHRQEVARLDEPVGRAPHIQIVREENHNDDGDYRGYAPVDKGGFGEFLQDVNKRARGKGESEKLRKLRTSIETRAALGANESIGQDGGYLTQSDHSENLFSAVTDAGVIASACTQVPMSNSSTVINMLDETSIANGSQFGGVTGGWRAEAGSTTASKPKFRREHVHVEVLEGLFYATDEQLEDAPQLGAFAQMAFTQVLSYLLDDAILNGNGAGKPLGINNAPGTIAQAAEGGQTADTVNYLNVDKMIDRLLVGSEEKAQFYYHPSLRQQLRNMIATPGAKTDFMVFTPGSRVKGTVDELIGYPARRLQQCKAPGDVGDIVLGDFSKYLLFKKGGLRASQSMHVAFLTSEQVFKVNMRANGMPMHNSAITDANGSVTRSAFVNLAAR